jgi:hypothetical protein
MTDNDSARRFNLKRAARIERQQTGSRPALPFVEQDEDTPVDDAAPRRQQIALQKDAAVQIGHDIAARQEGPAGAEVIVAAPVRRKIERIGALEDAGGIVLRRAAAAFLYLCDGRMALRRDVVAARTERRAGDGPRRGVCLPLDPSYKRPSRLPPWPTLRLRNSVPGHGRSRRRPSAPRAAFGAAASSAECDRARQGTGGRVNRSRSPPRRGRLFGRLGSLICPAADIPWPEA